MGIDSLSQSLTGQVSYNLTKAWRVELLQSFYRFNGFGALDSEIGIARKLGQRELLLYYSTQYHRVLFELAASQF